MEPVFTVIRRRFIDCHFYPQAPHGACLRNDGDYFRMIRFLSSGSAWSLSHLLQVFRNSCSDFYPQAPHGACPGITGCWGPGHNFYPQAPHGACQQKTPKICPIVIASFCNITNNMHIKNRFFTTLHILFSSFPVRISYEFHVHFTFAPENLIQYVNQFLFFLKFHQKLPVQAPQVHVQ